MTHFILTRMIMFHVVIMYYLHSYRRYCLWPFWWDLSRCCALAITFEPSGHKNDKSNDEMPKWYRPIKCRGRTRRNMVGVTKLPFTYNNPPTPESYKYWWYGISIYICIYTVLVYLLLSDDKSTIMFDRWVQRRSTLPEI